MLLAVGNGCETKRDEDLGLAHEGVLNLGDLGLLLLILGLGGDRSGLDVLLARTARLGGGLGLLRRSVVAVGGGSVGGGSVVIATGSALLGLGSGQGSIGGVTPELGLDPRPGVAGRSGVGEAKLSGKLVEVNLCGICVSVYDLGSLVCWMVEARWRTLVVVNDVRLKPPRIWYAT